MHLVALKPMASPSTWLLQREVVPFWVRSHWPTYVLFVKKRIICKGLYFQSYKRILKVFFETNSRIQFNPLVLFRTREELNWVSHSNFLPLSLYTDENDSWVSFFFFIYVMAPPPRSLVWQNPPIFFVFSIFPWLP